jgi:signal peptidase I
MQDTTIKPSFKAELYDWIRCFVSALVFSILLFVFLGRIIGIINISMQPTLYEGYKVAVSNLFYTPKQGDIIIFTKKSYSSDPLVKRVIATEGQTVDINFTNGDIRIDGQLLAEPYLRVVTHRQFDVKFPITVPEGCIFVMGDNRNESIDSRDSAVGMIDTRCILGRVYGIVTPFSRFGSVA